MRHTPGLRKQDLYTKLLFLAEQRVPQIGGDLDHSKMSDVKLITGLFDLYLEMKDLRGEIDAEFASTLKVQPGITWQEINRQTEIQFFKHQAFLSACSSEEYRMASEICVELLAMGVSEPSEEELWPTSSTPDVNVIADPLVAVEVSPADCSLPEAGSTLPDAVQENCELQPNTQIMPDQSEPSAVMVCEPEALTNAPDVAVFHSGHGSPRAKSELSNSLQALVAEFKGCRGE